MKRKREEANADQHSTKVSNDEDSTNQDAPKQHNVSKGKRTDSQDTGTYQEYVRSQRRSQRQLADNRDGDADPSEDERLPRTVFVGNVPVGTTSKDLKKLFKPYGAIESVRFRGVVPECPKIPKRDALLGGRIHRSVDTLIAYVVFADTEEVEKSVAEAVDGVNMTVLKEKHLRVTRASHKLFHRGLSIFLGNLPFDASEEDVVGAFQEAVSDSGSTVLRARIIRDKKTGVGRGIGFVSFDDVLGVRWCLNLQGQIVVGGRVVRMERADKMLKSNTKSFKRERKRVQRLERKRQRSE